MFGFVKSPEGGVNPEVALGKLPENPAEYQGNLNTPENGVTNLESAVKLARILEALEQEQGQ